MCNGLPGRVGQVHMTERERVLSGSSVNLFPFKEEHVTDRYVGWLNDPEVNRFLEVHFVQQTPDTALAYVRSFYGETQKYMWGICPKDVGDPIGTATLSLINRYHGSAGLGLLIGEKRYWGKGVSSEVIELIEAFAFRTLGLRRLTGICYAPNHGMNFTFKRLGFTLEGRLRQALLLSPGKYVDGHYWGILAEEWEARNQSGPHLERTT